MANATKRLSQKERNMASREICTGTGACLRCQAAGTGCESPEQLLLGPQDANAVRSLERILSRSGVEFESWGRLLALPPNPGGKSELADHLRRVVPEPLQAETRAAFVAATPLKPASILDAFLRAQSLGALLAQTTHEWVRDALTKGWLFSVYHPIIDARTGEPFAHEALLRARHPRTKETIGAGAIIDACEALNLHHVLDQQARRAAIHGAAALGLSGLCFINFMPNAIYDPEICLRTTMAAASETGTPLASLVFEVVETEQIPDLKRLKAILEYYRERGVGTAVDDMGAGFTALEHLTALRPDYVKIDRGLVVRAEYETQARHDPHEIMSESRTLGIKVICEGIETPGQMAVCQEAGADYLQGFLFARPANPPQIADTRPFTQALALAA